MKKKKNLLYFLVTIMSLILIACGSNNGETGEEATEGEPTIGGDSIVVWSGVTGPDGELIRQNIEEYNATNPDYPVELLAMEGGTLSNRLVTVTRSGEGVPDLALIASESVNQYAGDGLLDAWDDYLEGTEVKAENYLEEA